MYIINRKKASPVSTPTSKNVQPVGNGDHKQKEARRHYRKGNNLWAESFHAALAEYEIALQLDPDNPEYQSAVKHAKQNIEESPDGDH